jgi:uncharacterized Zn finger protein (UPF0148 family)
MKHTLSLSIDDDIISKIKQIAIDNNMKISEVAAKVFEAGFKMGEPVMVKCPLCSTEYLNKQGFCPKCKEELELRHKLIQNEKELYILKDRFDKLSEWKAKGLYVSDNELNDLKNKIQEIEGGIVNG